MGEVEKWLSQWFAERNEDVALSLEENYFEKNAIDSFGVIELIEDIESQYAMTFNEDDFQDRRFPTISGLAEIINSKVGNA